MNNKQRSLSNCVSIVILIIALFVTFAGWVTIYDRDLKNAAKEAVGELRFELNHMDDDDLDDLDDDLDRYNINISTKNVVKLMKHACNVLEDATFSPLEMGEISIGWSKIEKNLDSVSSLIGFGREGEVILDAITEVIGSFGVLVFLVLAFIVIVIITLVREIMNKDEKGYLFCIGAVVVVVYQMSMVSQINSKLTIISWATGMDKIITSMFAPYSLLILAAAMFAAKFFLGKNNSSMNYGTMGTMGNRATSGTMGNMGNMGMPQASYGGNVQGKVCSSCGTQLSANAAFCPNCGGAAASMANNVQQISCKSCGMKLDKGTAFCPNCGSQTAPAMNVPQQLSCKSCGMTLENGTVFCPNCGTKQD